VCSTLSECNKFRGRRSPRQRGANVRVQTERSREAGPHSFWRCGHRGDRRTVRRYQQALGFGAISEDFGWAWSAMGLACGDISHSAGFSFIPCQSPGNSGGGGGRPHDRAVAASGYRGRRNYPGIPTFPKWRGRNPRGRRAQLHWKIAVGQRRSSTGLVWAAQATKDTGAFQW